MNDYVGPMLLMAVAGILVGGAVALYKNGRRLASIGCALIGAAAFAGGAFLIYG
ncbi:hypothetical protein [Glycomyces tarimensis]